MTALTSTPDKTWTAVVLAGGRGTRMGGIAKPQLVLDGRTLLACLIDDLPTDVPIVVVGPEQPVSRAVVFCREDPPFGGPVAALAAAMPHVHRPTIGLVGADMPRAGDLLARIAGERTGDEWIVPLDDTGRRQPLCSAVATTVIRAALARIGDPGGASLRTLMDHVAINERVLSADDVARLRDIDTTAGLLDWESNSEHRSTRPPLPGSAP